MPVGHLHVFFGKMSVQFKYYMLSLICGIYKIQQTSESNQKKPTHRYRKQTYSYQGEAGRGNVGVEDKKVQIIRYKIRYKDLLYNMGNIASTL